MFKYKFIDMFGIFGRLVSRKQQNESPLSTEIIARHGSPVDPNKKYIPILKNGSVRHKSLIPPRSSDRNSGSERYERNNASNPHDIKTGGTIKRDAERAHSGIKSTPITQYGEKLKPLNRAKPQYGDGGYVRSSGFSEERLNGDIERAPRPRINLKKPNQMNVPAKQRIGLETYRDPKLFKPIGRLSRAVPAVTYGNSIRLSQSTFAQKPIY